MSGARKKTKKAPAPKRSPARPKPAKKTATKTTTTRRGSALPFDARAALKHLRTADPELGRLIDRVGPFRMQLKDTNSVFHALAEAIVHQQLTGKAAQTIWGRVCALYPRSKDGPTARLVAKTDVDTLRSAGLSRAKVKALHDLAEKTLSGHVPPLDAVHAMENDALVARLTEVRGIGKWTVEMLLMFRLGRPDVLPADDYGIRNGYRFAFGKPDLPDKKALVAHGARWAPYRTVASWYLWRAVDLEKAQ